jgi:thymidylate synthase
MEDIALNAEVSWSLLVSRIMRRGHIVTTRGREVKELLGQETIIDMNYPYVDTPLRRIGKRFRAAEAAWILSGDNRVETIAPYSKQISDFSDDGVIFKGAYGPHIVEQLPYVVETLLNDNFSRQAVITIWVRTPPPSKDIPCTISMQFFIRSNKLHCVVYMRSSDVWLGWVYDVHAFSMVSAAVLLTLRSRGLACVDLGNLKITTGSSHIYKEQWEACGEVSRAYSTVPANQFKWRKYNDRKHLIESLWETANKR